MTQKTVTALLLLAIFGLTLAVGLMFVDFKNYC